jgi:centromere/kinetochore protein ZW10
MWAMADPMDSFWLTSVFRYLYNDAMWLTEQLREYTTKWTQQEDLNPRTRGKVKLDSEIQTIEKFGRHAYAQEMSTQRTILNDLLGGVCFHST